MSEPIAFDLSQVIELTLKQSAIFRAKNVSREEQDRAMLVYALGPGMRACRFEAVQMADEWPSPHTESHPHYLHNGDDKE